MPEPNFGTFELRNEAMVEFLRRYRKIVHNAAIPGSLNFQQLAEILHVVEDNVSTFTEGLRTVDRAAGEQVLSTRAIRQHLADIEQCLLSGDGITPSASTAAALQEGIARIRNQIPTSLAEGVPKPSPVMNKGGRPGKWKWEGALIHLIAVANTPDGLPEGAGAQARIGELIANWFAANSEDGSTPAESEIKLRARLIMDELGR